MERICAVDGGGLRGVLSAEIGRRLTCEVPGWETHASIWAGTSTGAIIAAAMAKGLEWVDVVQLYRENAEAIFDDRDLWDKLVGRADEFFRANYDRDGIHAALLEVFGEDTLGDLAKHVVIPTFYLGDANRPASVKVLHNFENEGNDRHISVVDAIEASSAAPLYFPSKSLSDPRLPGQFIDGGVVLNNPSAAALAKALKMGRTQDGHDFEWLAGLRLLSISTGTNPVVVTGGDWGARQWVVKAGSPLVRVIFDGQVGVSDYLSREFCEAFGAKYLRIDVVLPKDVELDDVKAVPQLVDWANEADLSEAVDWLREHWVPGQSA